MGYSVAKHYNHLAKTLNKRYHSVVTDKMDLAFLPIETKMAKDYIKEMNYCIAYAYANRKLMMMRMKEAMEKVIGNF